MRNNFSTHAENFSNGVNTSVDPRTGLYAVALHLLSCSANNNLGPAITLGLAYDPLSLTDMGFGTGFSLGLTQYDSHTGTLNLSSGERYHVTETTGQPVIMLKKLNNFWFHKTDSSYEVVWKNGITETLMGPDNVSAIKLPVQMTAPSGHSVAFEWNYTGDTPRLTSVKDNHRVLLSLEYNDNLSTVMTLFPGSDETTTHVLTFANNNLIKLTYRGISSQNTGKVISLTWSFGYQNVGGLYLINSMETPTGLKEEVAWQADVMRFPEKSGLTALPAVVRHTRTPGAGQPAVITNWSWSDANYLGFGGTADWNAQNDYAFGIAGLYSYSSTEMLAGTTATITTIRTYNKFHLQTQEETNRNGAISRLSVIYHADDTAIFSEQPAQFLLPKISTHVLTDKNGKSGKPRITLSEFDEQGNPVSSTSPDGTVTTYTWYSPEGEDGCPPSSDGFTRYMKQQVVTWPTLNGYKDVPEETTAYTYSLLGESAFIVQDIQKYYSGSRLLKTVRTGYESAIDSAEFGRITSISETLHDLNYQNEYTSTQTFHTSITGDQITQKTVFTSHDKLKTTTSRTMSALTGLLMQEIDPQGVTTNYVYDGCGRLVKRTLADSSDYAHTTIWSHQISGTPSTTEIGPDGTRKTTYFDGEGRQIRIKVLDVDNTDELFEVYNTAYNDIGENISAKHTDWKTDDEDSTAFTLAQNVVYGEWGERQKTTVSYGLTAFTSPDPVELKLDNQLTGTLKGRFESNNVQSGLNRTHFDEQTLQTVRQENINIDGTLYSATDYIRDGRTLVRSVKDPAGNVTAFSFDALGRETERLLPDGSRLTRVYAPHLTGQQVTEISMTDAKGKVWLLGSREFDGLGRLKKESSGGRTTQYIYTGSGPLPTEVRQPDGSVLQYTYIAELGNAVSSLTTDGVTQTFSYDPLTGAALTSVEGQATNKNEWNPSGSLRRETYVRGDSTLTSDYTRLLSDAVMTWTDVNGKTMKYTRDEYGRITGIADEALTVAMEYDALGRVKRQTVADTVTDASLVTVLVFDDFSRETSRTVSDSNGTTVRVLSTWQQNDLLATRKTLQNDVTVRTEIFSYDVRNRLVNYMVSGNSLPVDGYGNSIKSQTYAFDALNNLTSVTTELSDDSTDTAEYTYNNPDDPTQLTSVMHTHTDYPQLISLEYDDCGRMTRDEAGRVLSYDAIGRLSDISDEGTTGGKYDYDALNRLITQQVSDTELRSLYYRGNELVSELRWRTE
ncbi:RHS repeat domain-containing protein [Pantoea sp. BAV 3049]|uniref:RHS repeat domain-containing protein n=1 Tax=Pantoea sp. BAV 3049 TaxID=2654188 RepID=UPI00131C8B7E|nr:RHS repeat protein [Pantoea sp. BAV 3049]